MEQGVMLGLWALGGLTLVFGVFSAASPQRSIALYQALMACINWRVSPIDAARELRMTRKLGVLMVLLSLAMGWVLASRPR